MYRPRGDASELPLRQCSITSKLPTTRGIDLLRNLHLECGERFFWEELVTPIKPRTFLLLIILALATWSYSFAFPAYT